MPNEHDSVIRFEEGCTYAVRLSPKPHGPYAYYICDKRTEKTVTLRSCDMSGRPHINVSGRRCRVTVHHNHRVGHVESCWPVGKFPGKFKAVATNRRAESVAA